MTQPPRIEAGTSRLFSVQYSANPITAPLFTMDIDSAEILVHSAQTNSAAIAYAFQAPTTLPSSQGIYRYRFTASFSASVGSQADITAGLVQVVTTRPWTT